MSKIRPALLLTSLLLTSVPLTPRAQAPQTPPTSPIAKVPDRVETQVSKTIAFITVLAKWPDKDGKPGKKVRLSGTGFWVSVPDARLPDGKSFVYLVTNRHVATAIEQDEKGNCTHLEIQQMFVTVNLKEPINGNRADTEALPLSQNIHWSLPKDEAIDLAVILVGLQDKFDYVTVQTEVFVTSSMFEDRRVVPGDRVLTGGFYTIFQGTHEIQPIFRQGILAMLPDGPVPMACGGMGKVYLADVHVIPGNSGSPIFLGGGVSFGLITNTFGLLGVVSGYMYENADLTLTAATTRTGSVNANSGISIVVPAQQLKDLLDSPELQQQRDEVVRAESKGHPQS